MTDPVANPDFRTKYGGDDLLQIKAQELDPLKHVLIFDKHDVTIDVIRARGPETISFAGYNVYGVRIEFVLDMEADLTVRNRL